MPRKITTENFIKRSNIIHNNKYDYSKTDLNNRDEHGKVCIICPEHGEFWQLPNVNLTKHQCPFCGEKEKFKKITKTTENFIEEAKKIHNSKYDYSKVKYVNNHTNVIITCPTHGDFIQKPNSHLHGDGCSKCSKKHNYTTEEWIEEARKIHGDRYDYSKVKYKNNHTEITIHCEKHGDFIKTPNSHLQKQGCPKCKSSFLENEIRNILEKNYNGIIMEQKKFDWMGKLSLDFYLPSKNIAIECQGEQHFKSKDFFGGEEEFKKQQNRDKRKKELCRENGLVLIYFLNEKYNKYMSSKDIYFNSVDKLFEYIRNI